MMKKAFFAILMILSSNLFPYAQAECLALDEDGCLTCHKCPGLMVLEKPDRYRVLHLVAIMRIRLFNKMLKHQLRQ